MAAVRRKWPVQRRGRGFCRRAPALAPGDLVELGGLEGQFRRRLAGRRGVRTGGQLAAPPDLRAAPARRRGDDAEDGRRECMAAARPQAQQRREHVLGRQPTSTVLPIGRTGSAARSAAPVLTISCPPASSPPMARHEGQVGQTLLARARGYWTSDHAARVVEDHRHRLPAGPTGQRLRARRARIRSSPSKPGRRGQHERDRLVIVDSSVCDQTDAAAAGGDEVWARRPVQADESATCRPVCNGRAACGRPARVRRPGRPPARRGPTRRAPAGLSRSRFR